MDEQNRYHRQRQFSPFGARGEKQLRRAHAIIVGCGALGGSAAQLLVRGGIGKLTLVDDDRVALDNLHRQILFAEADISQLKVEVAKRALSAMNRNVEIFAHAARFCEENADSLCADADFILDGCDHFSTRFLMNRVAIAQKKPFITAGVLGGNGQVFTILPHKTPCLACLIGTQENLSQNDSINTVGILSPIVQIVAAAQVAEIFKLCAGVYDNSLPRLQLFDVWNSAYRTMNVTRTTCAVCESC